MALYTNDMGTYFDDRLLEQIKHRKNDEVRSLLQSGDPRYLISSSAATLLHYAAEYGNEVIAQYLVDHGSNVDAQNQLKETPLMLALEGNFERTIEILLAADADVYLQDAYGKSVLCRLFDGDRSVSDEVIKMFLDRVAKDKRDDEFVATQLFEAKCPLYRAVHLKNARVTGLLLEKGTPIEVREPGTEKTALHIAVERLDLENVKMLLKHNADVNAKDSEDKTPLSLLPSFVKLVETIVTLLRRGSLLQESDCAALPFLMVLVNANGQAIRTYLQNNVDLNAIVKSIFDSFVRFYRLVRSLLNPDLSSYYNNNNNFNESI